MCACVREMLKTLDSRKKSPKKELAEQAGCEPLVVGFVFCILYFSCKISD